MLDVCRENGEEAELVQAGQLLRGLKLGGEGAQARIFAGAVERVLLAGHERVILIQKAVPAAR